MFKKYINLNKLSTLLFYISILLFIIAFNFAHNPPGGWYQQFLPNLNGQPLSGVIFLDSLTGFAITDNGVSNDTGYILKTTNGGDNWNIVFSSNRDYKAIDFINLHTGYVCGAQPATGSRLLKTTNSGSNWFNINPPDPFLVLKDISVLNEDTVWVVSDGIGGGVFRTTNGGTNWILQYNGETPDKIYMYNSRIGFITRNFATPTLRKTTDGGFNWFPVLNEGFSDMYFIDSLTGWKCWGEEDSIKKTTDGGITWQKLLLPPGVFSVINDFAVLNADTLWGVGAVSGIIRGLIYFSSNGGTTWYSQLPDTSIHIPRYFQIQFMNKLNGWSYGVESGVHTVTGGNIASISQIGLEISEDFELYQNYPNPFNPTTTIVFKVKSSKDIKLAVYDITGKVISIFVNNKLSSGDYKYVFDAGSIPSGVYFYSLSADGKLIDTKKMVLVR